MKAEIYAIFNDIQTRTKTSENLENFIGIFEKAKFKEFNSTMENVFLIIMKNYEKNNVVLKNLKDFIKSFIEKIMKSPKSLENTKRFINYFCEMFTSNTKKPKYKNLCIYFLNIFLIPYSNNFQNLYDAETLDNIKHLILSTLRTRQTSLHIQVLKLLQKHTVLQREKEIWERLENLLNTSSQIIKKEILKLLEIDNQNILKYLLDMYDDDSAEIRHFVFEKLSEIKNFEMIDAKAKVKLLYVGLTDSTAKVQQSAKKFLKAYLYSIGIFKNPKSSKYESEGKMDVDADSEDGGMNKNIKSGLKSLNLSSARNNEEVDDEEDEDEDLLETAKEKIEKISSPLKMTNKKKLKDSPSRIFDKLDVFVFYNHPKYSYTFELITEAIIEFTDHANMKDFIKNIVDNLNTFTNSKSEYGNRQSSDKKYKKNNINMMDISGGSFRSAGTGTSYDKTALFNDVYFLQNTIKTFSKKQDNAAIALKDSIIDLLPDNKVFAKIMSHFYEEELNVFILHQLFLIALNLNYEGEKGNWEMLDFLKRFIIDKDLESKMVKDEAQRKLLFDIHSPPDPFLAKFDEEIDFRKNMENSLENILLPTSRKIVMSLEDLLEYALKIYLKIHYNQPNILFATIMEPVNEMNDKESTSDNSIYFIKNKQKELIEKIKEIVNTIESLEERKKKDKNRIEIDRKLLNEQKALERLDDELFNLTREEKKMLGRMLKLCEFLIKYCKLPSQNYNNMVTDIILPAVQRKEFPDLMSISYNAMGLLAINHFKAYKNFLKLFFGNLQQKGDSGEFTEFNMVSLFIIFDSLLLNNFVSEENSKELMDGISVDEKINMIVRQYLYHHQNIPKLITFTGLCKILFSNRVGRPEFILSRLIVIGYKSTVVNERVNEDFNLKIYEIFKNFLLVYCYYDKTHPKSLIKAIMIVLTSHLLVEPHHYDRSVANDYSDTKFEFLNGLLKHLSQYGPHKIPIRKIIFKIFKYLYFLAFYILEDHEKMVSTGDYKENSQKKIKIGYSTKKRITHELFKFFAKSNYDKFLLSEMTEEHYLKLFPFILNMNEISLKFISPCFYEHLNALKEKNYVYEYLGRTVELNSEEKMNEFREYVNNKELKYYKMFEETFTFLNNLKEDKLNIIIEENSIINEEDEKSVRTSLNVSMKSQIKKKRKSPIVEEAKDEENDDLSKNKPSSTNTKNNKRRSSPFNAKKKNTNKK